MTFSPREVLAMTVRQARKRRKWSQPELAVRSGVNINVVTSIERMAHSPSFSAVVKIFEALGIQISYQQVGEPPQDLIAEYRGKKVTKQEFRMLFPDMTTMEAAEFHMLHPEISGRRRLR